MAVCRNCGAAPESGQCPTCQTSALDKPETQVIDDNVASALCYLALGVTGVLFLFLAPYNRNRRVRFHAFQAIFVNLAIIIFWIAISLIGQRVALLISPLFMLACLILWLALIWTAWHDRRIILPLIGTIAEKQA